MKTSLLLAIITISINSYSQNLKKKSKTEHDFKEIYYINKKDKTKNGEFIKLRNSSGDTLIIGNYSNDKKTGIWSYYSYQKKNKLHLKYNHDLNELVYKSDTQTHIDSFTVFVNNEYELLKIDSPPIFIGFEDEIRINLALRIKVSKRIIQKKLTGFTIVSLEIDENGQVSNTTIEQSLEESFDNSVIDALADYKEGWIPAVNMNKKIASKIFIALTVQKLGLSPSQSHFKIEKKPHIWPVDFTYF